MMNRVLSLLGLLVVLGIAAFLYVATLDETQQDPCADTQNDISGALLSDNDDDQDALANRAIAQRGACKPRE
jgi:hypothetical protein